MAQSDDACSIYHSYHITLGKVSRILPYESKHRCKRFNVYFMTQAIAMVPYVLAITCKEDRVWDHISDGMKIACS